MSTLTLTAMQYADLIRGYDCVQAPVAIGGYLYAVVRGAQDQNIYRVAIA